MKLGLYLTVFIKVSSKWTEDIKIRPESIRVLEENLGPKIHDIGFGSSFLDVMLKAQSNKRKYQQMDFMKMKNFSVYQKTPSTKWNAVTDGMGENIFKLNI